MATIDQALDLLFSGDRAELSATQATIDAYASGAVAEATCDKCNGRGSYIAGVSRVRRAKCDRCFQRGKVRIDPAGTTAQEPSGTQQSRAHLACTSHHFNAGRYPSLGGVANGSPRGCAGCDGRGYVTGLDAQGRGGPPEPSSEIPDFDPRWPFQRWLRSLPAKTRAAVEAWHSPAAVQWRAELAADRKLYRDARQPLPPDCARELNLAPLMPLTSAGRAAQRVADAYRPALTEYAIRQATELLDLVKDAERKLAVTLRFELKAGTGDSGVPTRVGPKSAPGVSCQGVIGAT